MPATPPGPQRCMEQREITPSLNANKIYMYIYIYTVYAQISVEVSIPPRSPETSGMKDLVKQCHIPLELTPYPHRRQYQITHTCKVDIVSLRC